MCSRALDVLVKIALNLLPVALGPYRLFSACCVARLHARRRSGRVSSILASTPASSCSAASMIVRCASSTSSFSLQRDPGSPVGRGLVASSHLGGDHAHSAIRRKTGFKPYGIMRSGGLDPFHRGVVTRTPPQQCSIALWRGYVKAQFYAREQGYDRALRVSPLFPIWHFPWEHSQPLEVDPRARAALVALRDDLLADGVGTLAARPENRLV